MPSASNRPFLLHTSISLVLMVMTWMLWPSASETWRKMVVVILSSGLGFQIAKSIHAAELGRVAALKAWLECGAFPLVMGAFYFLPNARGWILLLAGWSWRFLVSNLWK